MVHTHANLGRFLIMSDEAILSLNGSVNKTADIGRLQIYSKSTSGHYTVLRSLCGVPYQHRELLGPTFLRAMTVSL